MKIGNIFAGAGLLVLPFIFSYEGEQMRDPKARFLVLMAGLYLASLLWRKIHPSLGCGAAIVFLSGAYRSIIMPFEHLLVFGAALSSCLWLCEATEDDIKRGLKVLEISGLLCAFWIALQFFHLDPILTFPEKAPPMAFFGQHTLYGPFAVACFASALFNNRRIVAIFLLIPAVLVNSSFTYLSLLVVFSLYAVDRLRAKTIGFLCIIGLSVLLMANYFYPYVVREMLDDKGRFDLWKQTYQIGARHPILGHGLGSFRVIYPIFESPELRKANGIDDSKQSPEMLKIFARAEFLKKSSGLFVSSHNEFLQAFFEFGLIGVFVVFWMIFAFISSWLALPNTKENWALLAIFAAVLANSIGNFPLHLIPQALLPLWSFALVTRRARRDMLVI